METGDVVARIGPLPDALRGQVNRTEWVDDVGSSELTPEEAKRLEMQEYARLERLATREAARQAEKPRPDPWDAWREQKAPPIFESEVTHRG